MMKIILMIALLLALTACGTDEQQPPAQVDTQEAPAAPTIELLKARYDLITRGGYFYNEERINWESGPGLLPTEPVVTESAEFCGRTMIKHTQAFDIRTDALKVSGSSVMYVEKVTALEHVYRAEYVQVELDGVVTEWTDRLCL